MKTVLIPTEDHDTMPAVLETARLIAARYDSYIEGFAVRPAASNFVAVDPVSSLTMPPTDEGEAEMTRAARSLFESFMRTKGIPAAQPDKTATLSHSWTGTTSEDDAFVGSHGRLFDLIVLGRPGRGPRDPRMAPLEAALFESGRPVLIAPPTAPKEIGRNILVAWNASTEQARANASALPLLRDAAQVTVLSIEGWTTPGPTGEQAARFFRMDGVKATAVTIKTGSRSAGEAILDHAKSLGCDLIVKGAYTQSRLRQMIFGGATRHVLAAATLPVLMAH